LIIFTKQACQLFSEIGQRYSPARLSDVKKFSIKCLVFQVDREHVLWRTGVKQTLVIESNNQGTGSEDLTKPHVLHESELPPTTHADAKINPSPAPYGEKIPLYDVAHSRAGDKGNDLNFSIIPHFAPDIERLKLIITPKWVKEAVSTLLSTSSFPNSDANDKEKCVDEHVKVEIYEVEGIQSLNVVVRNILDGGVNCSRRIDRHGKTISDLILCQRVMLPP
jgi:hypothetical protein